MENTFSRIISFLIFAISAGFFFWGFLEESYNYILLILSLIFFGFGLYILLNENEDKIERIKSSKKFKRK